MAEQLQQRKAQNVGTWMSNLDTELSLAWREAALRFGIRSDYRVFDEQFFQETLNDWTWYAGTLPAPPWYKGRPCG